jgi:Competence protein CoiA-like family
MLSAVNVAGVALRADVAPRKASYTCPECGAGVVLKRGTLVSAHFAHQVRSPACSLEGETEEHQWMKWQMTQRFGREETRLEVALIPGHRADVVVPTQRLVIECQVSPIAIPEWERRTRDYNQQGYAVLWVWALERLGVWLDDPQLPAIEDGEGEVRVAAEVLHCHRCAYGRVYTLGTPGHLIAVHLRPVMRQDGPSVWYLKTTRTVVLKRVDPQETRPHVTVHRETGLRLAQIEREAAWWR